MQFLISAFKWGLNRSNFDWAMADINGLFFSSPLHKVGLNSAILNEKSKKGLELTNIIKIIILFRPSWIWFKQVKIHEKVQCFVSDPNKQTISHVIELNNSNSNNNKRKKDTNRFETFSNIFHGICVM